jgi:hypothetical protein
VNARARLWSIPAVLWIAFTVWYTDFGGPLTPEEIDRYVGRLETQGAAPERIAGVRAFMEADTGRQFVMVNLIDMADAPAAVRGAPDGADADDLLDLYMEHMYPALFARACHPVFVGDAVAVALDLAGIEGGGHWDRGALMRYRSRRDMIEIATTPEFSGRHDFKVAALDKTIAFPVETVLHPGDPRLLLGLLLLAIAGVADAIAFRAGR